MNLKRIILFAMFFASTLLFAQSKNEDIVLIDGMTFKQVSKNDINGIGGPMLRGQVDVLVKSIDTSKKGANPNWIRNIEVELIVGFEDKKTKGSWVLLDAKAKIFAAQRGKKTPIVFYIPWESYDMYRIAGDPDFFKISLWADGKEFPLDEKNVKTRVSKTITSLKALTDFEAAATSQAARNRGVLKPLNECATNVQFFEYSSSRVTHPTYLDAK